jgi:hypothetical protein
MKLSKKHITPLVVRAGRGFRAAEGKDPAIEGAALAEWLRSGAEIGEADRELLAQLVTGEWRRSAGGESVNAGQEVVQNVVFELRQRVEKGEKKEAAKEAVAQEYGVSRATVENYERMVKDREKAISEAKTMIAQYRNP